MIKRTSNGWYVYSQDGTKELGGPYHNKQDAVKRLAEVEYFKGHSMNLNDAFNNLGETFAREYAPDTVTQPAKNANDNSPDQSKMTQKKNVSIESNPAGGVTTTDLNGTIAGIKSPLVKDGKDHFPIYNEAQARSALYRAMRVDQIPNWFAGTINDLHELVVAGIKETFPKLEITVAMNFQEALASTITNPADKVKSKVPNIPRPNLDLTGNQNDSQLIEKVISSETPSIEDYKAIAGALVRQLQSALDGFDQQAALQKESLQASLDLANRLETDGLSGDEFQMLSGYLQSDIFGSLCCNNVQASKRQTLATKILNKYKK